MVRVLTTAQAYCTQADWGSCHLSDILNSNAAGLPVCDSCVQRQANKSTKQASLKLLCRSAGWQCKSLACDLHAVELAATRRVLAVMGLPS